MPADDTSRRANTAAPLQLLAGLSDIAADYDGFILDLWGVLHDGGRPYPDAPATLRNLIARGKRIVILSNAPRRAASVERRMNEIGIAPGLYHHVLSSGEETYQHLVKRDEPFYAALGERCYHIGSPRDEDMVEGVGFRRVPTMDEADFILNTGPWEWGATVAQFEERLQRALARDVPMVCANPDLVVMHEDRMSICAGAIAQRYEEIGGRVRWHGKPFRSVYETCFTLLGIDRRQRILGVGDSLRTDIAGANGAGIDGLLVAGGIHAEEFGLHEGDVPDVARIRAAVAASGHVPRAAIARFVW